MVFLEKSEDQRGFMPGGMKKRKERVYLEQKCEEKEMINIKRTHFLGLESPKSVEKLENLGVIYS